MKPLIDLSQDRLSAIKLVLADIDDTITSDGRLTAEAFDALEKLHLAGFTVVPVTGRPAGWCDHIARMWPVDAVVGENGAFYFRYDRVARRMHHHFWVPLAERKRHRAQLDVIALEVLADVAGSALASDQPYRVADLAIDFCEDVPPLPPSDVARIVSIFERHGAVAKVSSIHVNGWYGDYDKLSMSKMALRELFGLDWEAARDSVIYVGDSPNDEPLFGAFPISVGVANIHRFAKNLKHLPTFVTQRNSGAGFVELTHRLLASRKQL